MSKCVIYTARREFGVIARVKYCRRKWVTNIHFCYPENLSLIFKIISVRPASLLSRKYLLVEGKEFFCSWKVSKFLHPASFANACTKIVKTNFPSRNTGKGLYGYLIYLLYNDPVNIVSSTSYRLLTAANRTTARRFRFRQSATK